MGGGLTSRAGPAPRGATGSELGELGWEGGFSRANRYRTASLEHREYWRPLRIRRSARAERARDHRNAAAPGRRPLDQRTSVAAQSSGARAAGAPILLASSCQASSASSANRSSYKSAGDITTARTSAWKWM